MLAEDEAQTGSVEMLPGVRHYETSGFADTWAVYDALTEQDGWREERPLTRGDQAPPSDYSRWKRKTVDGRALVVHAPTHDRLDEATGSGRR